MTSPSHRVHKPKLPARVIVGAFLIAALLFGFITLAIYLTNQPIQRAMMAGTIASKEFVPLPKEKQITVGQQTGLSARTVEGEYILRVEVRNEDGTTSQYKVWMPNRESFDAVQVGDPFNVGPYLQR